MNAQDVGVLLLAAGRSQRFGPADKLAAPLDGIPLARHAAETLSRIPFGMRIAVCAGDLPVDWQTLGFEEVRVTGAPMLSASIAAGIARLRASACAACLIALADMPFVPQSHFEALIAHAPAPVVATVCGGRNMVPARFARESWDALAHLSGDTGARALLADAPALEVPADWRTDIDTVTDLARLARPASDT